jgi:hypothetical protein
MFKQIVSWNIQMPLVNFTQIFPYDSLFDLLYQFENLVFIVSRNTPKKKTVQFMWAYILTMIMIVMMTGNYVMILRDKIRMIQHFTSNTSYIIEYEATCFGPYMTIIRPSYESSQ